MYIPTGPQMGTEDEQAIFVCICLKASQCLMRNPLGASNLFPCPLEAVPVLRSVPPLHVVRIHTMKNPVSRVKKFRDFHLSSRNHYSNIWTRSVQTLQMPLLWWSEWVVSFLVPVVCLKLYLVLFCLFKSWTASQSEQFDFSESTENLVPERCGFRAVTSRIRAFGEAPNSVPMTKAPLPPEFASAPTQRLRVHTACSSRRCYESSRAICWACVTMNINLAVTTNSDHKNSRHNNFPGAGFEESLILMGAIIV